MMGDPFVEIGDSQLTLDRFSNQLDLLPRMTFAMRPKCLLQT